MAMTSQGVGHLEKIQQLVFSIGLLVLCLVSSSHENPITRQVGISENVFITVQNDTYGIEQRVCSIDSVTYEDGDSIPTSSPCEHCICRPPGFACTIISCEYRPGCKALKRSNQCCPEYQCECEKDGKIYQNGEKILDNNNPCEICYCQGGDVVCAVIDCYWRSDCQPRYIENRCCPLYDHCPPSQHPGGPIHRLTSTTTQMPFPSSWFNMTGGLETTAPPVKRVPTFTRRPTTTTTTESSSTTRRTESTTTAISSSSGAAELDPIVDNLILPPSQEPVGAESAHGGEHSLSEDGVNSVVADSIGASSTISEESMSFTTWNTEITHAYPTNVVEDFTPIPTSASSQPLEPSTTERVEEGGVGGSEGASQDLAISPTSVSGSVLVTVTATDGHHVVISETQPSLSENAIIFAAQTNNGATPELSTEVFVIPSESVLVSETVAPVISATSALGVESSTPGVEAGDAPPVVNNGIAQGGGGVLPVLEDAAPGINEEHSGGVGEELTTDQVPVTQVQGSGQTVEDAVANTIDSVAPQGPTPSASEDESIKEAGINVVEATSEKAVGQGHIQLTAETTVEPVTETPDVVATLQDGVAQVAEYPVSIAGDVVPESAVGVGEAEPETTLSPEASSSVSSKAPVEESSASDALKEPSAESTLAEGGESHADAPSQEGSLAFSNTAPPLPDTTEVVAPAEEIKESEKVDAQYDVTTGRVPEVPEAVTEDTKFDGLNDSVGELDTTQEPLKVKETTVGVEVRVEDDKAVGTTQSSLSIASDDVGSAPLVPIFESVVETTVSGGDMDDHDGIYNDGVVGVDELPETTTSSGKILESGLLTTQKEEPLKVDEPVRDEGVESVTGVSDFVETTTGVEATYSDPAAPATTNKPLDSKDSAEELAQSDDKADDGIDYQTTYLSVPSHDDTVTELYDQASPLVLNQKIPHSPPSSDDLNEEATATSASTSSDGIMSDEPIKNYQDEVRETTETGVTPENVDIKFDNVGVTDSGIQFDSPDTTPGYSDAVGAETDEQIVTTDASTLKVEQPKIVSQRLESPPESNEIIEENLSSKFRLDPLIFSESNSGENAIKTEEKEGVGYGGALVETTFRPVEEKAEVVGSADIVFDAPAPSSDNKADHYSTFETTTLNSRLSHGGGGQGHEDKSGDVLHDFQNGATTTKAEAERDSAVNDESTVVPETYDSVVVATEAATDSNGLTQDEPEVSTLSNPSLLQRHHLPGHAGTGGEETTPVSNYQDDIVQVPTTHSPAFDDVKRGNAEDFAKDDAGTTESGVRQSDQAEDTTTRPSSLFRSDLPISSEESEVISLDEPVKFGDVKEILNGVTSSPQENKSVEALTEGEERDAVDGETTPSSALLQERQEEGSVSHDVGDETGGESTIVNTVMLSKSGEDSRVADEGVETSSSSSSGAVEREETLETSTEKLNASLYTNVDENIVISSLPNENVKKIDPIIDDLGLAGLGRSDLTLQDSMKSEQNAADEAWYWRAMNRIRNLPHFFPSVRTRSPRTG